MASVSEGERHGGPGKVDAEGHYVSAILPYVKGVAAGTIKVTLTAAKCAPTVSVAWGRRK